MEWSINMDFASLYPNTMKDWTKDAKLMSELLRLRKIRERKEKLERINEINNDIHRDN